MLYTIMPIDIILSHKEQFDCQYNEKTIDGQLVQVTKDSDNKYAVVRVIATDPNVFLNQKFQPGMKL